MVKSYRLSLDENPQIIVDESESCFVRLNFLGLTKTVYVGDSSVDETTGFPLKNEDFKYRNWDFFSTPGDKFCAMTLSPSPVILNVLVMSRPTP